MDIDLSQTESKCQETLGQFKEKLTTIRTGKATPALIENIIVSAYQGTVKMKLLELASISVNDAHTLCVSPYDATILPDIEKAIQTSPIHLTCRVEGKLIYIAIPALTEEQRNQFVKIINATTEEYKNRLRSNRDDIRKRIKLSYEEKTITQDDKFRLEKDVDEIITIFSEKLDEIKSIKTNEITTI